ncbi:MAG: hypothetical protein M1457_11530 [bacterium]|nr:hypothetical protein [bacterium]
MKAQRVFPLGWGTSLLAWVLFMMTAIGWAQTLGELEAAQGIAGTLDSQSVGPNPVTPIQKAQDAAAAAAGAPGQPGVPPGVPGVPEVPGAPPGVPGAPEAPGAPPAPGAQAGVPGATPSYFTGTAGVAKITVITGTRVFDKITGELLDDAVEREVPEPEKDNYYDDGTHGDLVAGDGKYTKVSEVSDVIGGSNQRVKEQLIQSLVVAEQLNPIQFFGYTLLSLGQQESTPRNRAWKLVPNPDGGPGMVLAERPTDPNAPVEVKKYRTEQMAMDKRIKDDWAVRFLQEYRTNKDSLTSEFFPLYIPLPPQTPNVPPPPSTTWQPFSASATGGGGAVPLGPIGVPGAGMGAAPAGSPLTSSQYMNLQRGGR